MANPFINCPRHGKQEYEVVCEHLNGSFDQGIYPDFHKIRGLTPAWVCNDCFSEYRMERYDQITVKDLESLDKLPADKAEKIMKDFSQTYKRLNKKPVCNQCIAELELQMARNEDRPLPFKPFENTLGFLEIDLVNELKELLISSFDFESIPRPEIGMNIPSLSVAYGAVTYPLTIKIYRKRVPEEQQKILELIDHFFYDVSKKQRNIKFFGDMFWVIEKSNGFVTRLKRDSTKDELLLEKEIY